MNCVKVRIISAKIYAEHARICVQLSTEKAVHAVKTVNSAHSPAHHHTACQAGDFIDEEAILSGCREAWEQGVNRYCIVTAGRAIKDEDFEKALHAYKKMHAEFPDMILCASHGFVSEEKLKQLKEAGVSMYHENIETSEENFPNVCTTHSFEDKIHEIKRIQEAGLELCTGGIVGMGETWKDRLSMAFTLAELGTVPSG